MSLVYSGSGARQPLGQRCPLLNGEVRLVQNTVQSSDRDLPFVRHNYRVDHVALSANKFDVAAPLTRFEETSRSSRRLISRKGSGLSRPNLDLDGAYSRRPRRPRGLEVQFKSLF